MQKSSVSQSSSSRGRIDTPKWSEVRNATFRMGRSVRGVPSIVANIWYGFTRSAPRNTRGHLCGTWPDVARAFAERGAPLIDVMAPAYEVERELKREVYGRALPSLAAVEAMDADVVCRIQKAEIAGDIRTLREVAREERVIAELLEEVAEQQLDAKRPQSRGPGDVVERGSEVGLRLPEYRTARGEMV